MKIPHPVCKHGEKDRDWKNLLLPTGVDVADIMTLGPPGLPAPLPPIVITEGVFCLRRLKINLDLAREGNAFSAEVWFRGELIGYAYHDGGGGAMRLEQLATVDDATIKVARDWAWRLPPQSSHQPAYADMARCSPQREHGDNTMLMSLDWMIEDIVARAADRQSIEDIESYAIHGPATAGARVHDTPYIAKWNGPVTEDDLMRSRRMRKWACRLSDVFDIPYHYYPAPHPFGGIGYPRQIVRVNKRELEVLYGTNDRRVVIGYDEGDEGDTLTVEPERCQLVDVLDRLLGRDSLDATK